MAGNGKQHVPQIQLPRLRPTAPAMISWPFQQADSRPEIPGTGHLHWGITAFHHSDENNALYDAVQVEVEAASEEEAVARAMAILERAYYRVAWVKEACSIDPSLTQRA